MKYYDGEPKYDWYGEYNDGWDSCYADFGEYTAHLGLCTDASMDSYGEISLVIEKDAELVFGPVNHDRSDGAIVPWAEALMDRFERKSWEGKTIQREIPFCCPICNSTHYEVGNSERMGDFTTDYCYCNECGSEWTNTYGITTTTINKVGEGVI